MLTIDPLAHSPAHTKANATASTSEGVEVNHRNRHSSSVVEFDDQIAELWPLRGLMKDEIPLQLDDFLLHGIPPCNIAGRERPLRQLQEQPYWCRSWTRCCCQLSQSWRRTGRCPSCHLIWQRICPVLEQRCPAYSEHRDKLVPWTRKTTDPCA